MKRLSQRDNYYVVEWWREQSFSLVDLFRRVPELVVGRYLVNTSFDSGMLTLAEEEKRAGWHSAGSVTYSPKILSPADIPHDGFEEWLIFESPTAVIEYESIVNHDGFGPMYFSWTEKRELFWEQVRRLRPLHVVGENSDMYLVTGDPKIYEKAQKA